VSISIEHSVVISTEGGGLPLGEFAGVIRVAESWWADFYGRRAWCSSARRSTATCARSRRRPADEREVEAGGQDPKFGPLDDKVVAFALGE
jgi:hypothetical protein